MAVTEEIDDYELSDDICSDCGTVKIEDVCDECGAM